MRGKGERRQNSVGSLRIGKDTSVKADIKTTEEGKLQVHEVEGRGFVG